MSDRCTGQWRLPSGLEGVVLLLRGEWKEALEQWTGRTGRTLSEGCRVGLREGTIGYWVRYVRLPLLLSWSPLPLAPRKLEKEEKGKEGEKGGGGRGGEEKEEERSKRRRRRRRRSREVEEVEWECTYCLTSSWPLKYVCIHSLPSA